MPFAIRQLSLCSYLVVLIVAVTFFYFKPVKAQQQNNNTCQTLWTHFTRVPNNNDDPFFCCNTTLLRQVSLHVTCNNEKEITTLIYDNNDSSNIKCDNNTISIISQLPKLEQLTLNYYIDQATCPLLFNSLSSNNSVLRTLEIRGTQFLSTPPTISNSNATTISTLSPIQTLDLSESNIIPSWIIPDLFPSVKHFVLLGLNWQQNASSLNTLTSICGLLTNLTLDISSPNSSLFLSNCTNLIHLDIQIQDEQSAMTSFDVSKWLTPLFTKPQKQHLQSLIVATVGATHQKQHATFPTWLSQLTQLSSFSYHANIVDIIPSDIFSTLPLQALNLTGNRIYGALPSDGLSNIQLDTLDLSNNELTGEIPSSVRDTKTCNLSGNPILCSGIGNSWNLCQHCQLVPSFGDIMRQYMIQWVVVGVCLVLILCVWIYITLKKHQHTSFICWITVFYSAFSTINLITMMVHLGLQVMAYKTSFIVIAVTTGIYLLANTYLYRYCCRRFSILVIRRTWPVFLFCTLDLNNFGLYEIRMLNLSAYRLPIDHRVPIVFSWIKVFVADIPHTIVAIYLMMLHAPVASVLLTCITSGLGVVRAIIQVIILSCLTRQHRKFQPMARASPDDDDDTFSQTSIHAISRGTGQNERDKSINNMSAAAESSTTTTTTTKNQVELTHLIK
ncbi:hypothetical protein INT45_011538 [Circinella minor]|uniref:L domain-like protein n=1 Tax=Circinella minor TaxID=1195481 RepID=A0A8H7VLD9_9FUNG|nr:hypothetical protein INT45_011538 [Circinella minor]